MRHYRTSSGRLKSRQNRIFFEALEARTLFAGVTLVTHGFSLEGEDNVTWVNAMAQAIANRAGSGTPVFNLVVAADSTLKFTQVSGEPVDANPDGNVVIALNWSALSNDVLHQLTNTAYIANLIAPVFTETDPAKGIDFPLGDLPIHLIGHSRGGSLVPSLAEDLGADGLWVDQLTTLDPHPVQTIPLILDPDPSPLVYSNVVFADNYYETDAVYPDGEAVSGAHNVVLNGVLPSGPILDATQHQDVHSYYYGTVNTSATSDGDSPPTTINPAWYTHPGTGPRTSTGFYYSLIAGGVRPQDGIGKPFGGGGARVAIAKASGPQWPNVDSVQLTDSGSNFLVGQALHAQYLFQDGSSASTVTLYLDSDENPFDGSSNYKVASPSFGTVTAPSRPTTPTPLSTTGVPAGTYYVVAKITDGAETRYAYDGTPIHLTTPGSIAGSVFNDVNFTGSKVATDGPLSGWVITLNNGATATTNSAGNYVFNNLAPASYTVTETVKAGWLLTTPATSSISVVVSAGKTASGPVFGDTQKAVIAGTLFYDKNGNGIQDAGEAGLANWEVTIQSGNGPAELLAPTDSTGFFGTVVSAGTYIVKLVPMAGYKLTTPGSLTIKVGTGAGSFTNYFGVEPIK